MKKVLALLIVVAIAAPALAQDSAIWLDIRANNSTGGVFVKNHITSGTPTRPWIYDDAGGVVAGDRGFGQVVYIEPHHNDGSEALYPTAFPNVDLDNTRGTCKAYIYMDVFNDPSGTNGVISSIGYDITIDENSLGGARNRIGSMSYTWLATPPAANGGTVGGAAFGGAGAMPMGQTGCKLVQVPVCDEGAGPVFCSNPMFPVGGPYQLARLDFTNSGVARNCTVLANANRSVFDLWLTTNDLLVTRTFETGGDGNEMVSYGYAAGGVLDAAISGSTPGVRSATADMVVKSWVKGDFNGDGKCTGADLSPYFAAAGAANDSPDKTFRGDFSGDGQVTGADSANMFDCTANHSACP